MIAVPPSFLPDLLLPFLLFHDVLHGSLIRVVLLLLFPRLLATLIEPNSALRLNLCFLSIIILLFVPLTDQFAAHFLKFPRHRVILLLFQRFTGRFLHFKRLKCLFLELARFNLILFQILLLLLHVYHLLPLIIHFH